MTVNYHPSTELLTAYSAGSVPLSQALCLAAHLEMCPGCKQNYERLKKLGAYMFSENEKKDVGESASTKLRERVFSIIDDLPAEPQTREAAQTTAHHDDASHADIKHENTVPRCLRQFVKDNYDALPWKRVSPSIRQANLCTDSNGAQVALLRIKPGGRSGHHTHMGDEYTMVLKGAFSDETGIFQKGDFILRSGKHKHRPIATKDSECICLTVLEAPIQFTGFFTRWLNPLLRLTHPTARGQPG